MAADLVIEWDLARRSSMPARDYIPDPAWTTVDRV